MSCIVRTQGLKGQYNLKHIQMTYFKILLFQGNDDIIFIRMLIISTVFFIIASIILPCWQLMQRPMTGQSAEHKQLLRLNHQWDISVFSSKTQGALPREGRNGGRHRGHRDLREMLFRTGHDLHIPEFDSCAYLPKACWQQGPSAFQHG